MRNIEEKKEAKRLSQKKYREANREKIRESSKKYSELYRKNNSEKVKEYNRIYQEIPEVKNREREKRQINSENLKEYQIEYKKNNPDKRKETNDKSNKKSRKANPERFAWRDVLTNCLNRLGQKKEGHTIDLLGYSVIELKNYITSLFTEGMSWDNHGEWHIDHIKPVSKFDKETPMNIVNALSNLQPLWATTREINGVIYIGNLNKNNKTIKINIY